jgi:Zn-dependent oligopeptidase
MTKELTGLADNQLAATVAAAKDEHQEEKLVIRLQNTTGQPILGSLQSRPLRQRIMEASLSRNSKGGHITIVRLSSASPRCEQNEQNSWGMRVTPPINWRIKRRRTLAR